MAPKSIYLVILVVVILANIATAEDSPLAKARETYRQCHWQHALDLFLSVSRTASEAERDEAAFYAAECLLQLERRGEALEQYRQSLERAATKSDHKQRALFRIAEIQHLNGDITAARQSAEQLIDSMPGDKLSAMASCLLGEIALQTGDYQKAITSFYRAIDVPCGEATLNKARLGLARALLAARQYIEVPIAVGRLCQSDDANLAADAILLVGRAKYEAGSFDEALATFRRVYLLDANRELSSRARLAAGWALWKLSRHDEVGDEVVEANDDSTYRGELCYLLGMNGYASRNFAEAINKLDEAVRLKGNHQDAAKFYLAESYLLSGQLEKAAETFEKLAEVGEASAWADDAAWGCVRIARATGSKKEMKIASEQLRSLFPSSEYVVQLKGLTAIESKLFDEAVSLERDGRFDAATAAYGEFLDRESDSPLRAEGLWRIARLHDRRKQLTEAAKYYDQLVIEFPKFDRLAEVIASLARIEDSQRKTTKACEWRQILVEKFPQTLQGAEAAYCLALAAADEKKCDEAQRRVDWLMKRLDPKINDETRLRDQVLCLQCQLWAWQEDWAAIARLLDEQRAVTKDAVGVRLNFWRAEAAFRLRDYTTARERLEALETEVIGIHEPWVPMISLRRAQLAAKCEDWQQVLHLVERIDARYPEFELAYECDYLRGRARAGRGEMSAARSAYDDVLENEWAVGTETAAMAQWMIGETYFHQKNYELALVAYGRVIERHNLPKWQARSALQQGKCAELMQDWQRANEIYVSALERWGETSSRNELAARMEWTQQRVADERSTIRR